MARTYATGDVPAVAMAIGMPLGVALGLALGEPAYAGIGVAIGAGAGLAVGTAIESDLRKKSRIRPLTKAEKTRRRRFGLIGLAAGALVLVAVLTLYFAAS